MFKMSENKIKLEKLGSVIALWSHHLRWLRLSPKLLHDKTDFLFHPFSILEDEDTVDSGTIEGLEGASTLFS